MKNVYDFDKNMAVNTEENTDIVYYDVKGQNFSVYGSRAINEDGFCRFTKAQRDFLQPISDGEAWFSRQSSGVQVKFATDATDIYIKAKIASPFDMTNMTQIGQCGFDLYVYDEVSQKYVLHGACCGTFRQTQYSQKIGDFNQLGKKERRFIINFPLYMETESLSIGLNDWAAVKKDFYSSDKIIAVYGTSITHGCCASRPGMSYTNILSRDLDCEFLNFGFSGVANMEEQVADILGDIDYDLLFIDTEANAGINANLKNNCKKFLDTLLKKRPNLSIVLLSRIKFAMDLYDLDRINLNAYYIEYMRNMAKSYRKSGYKVYFYDQSRIFSKDFTEYTVEGIHPTDIGMVKIARFYKKIIQKHLTQ